MTDRDRLSAAALRLTASDPAYVGYWLDRHREHERLTAAALAAKLKLPADKLASLALCRTPGADTFVADVTAVCESTGADRGALATLLRQEQNLATWAAGPAGAAAGAGAGWMLAAYDADQPPPGDDGGPTDDRPVG